MQASPCCPAEAEAQGTRHGWDLHSPREKSSPKTIRHGGSQPGARPRFVGGKSWIGELRQGWAGRFKKCKSDGRHVRPWATPPSCHCGVKVAAVRAEPLGLSLAEPDLREQAASRPGLRPPGPGPRATRTWPHLGEQGPPEGDAVNDFWARYGGTRRSVVQGRGQGGPGARRTQPGCRTAGGGKGRGTSRRLARRCWGRPWPGLSPIPSLFPHRQRQWVWGPGGHGAILLVNCDRDDLSCDVQDNDDQHVRCLEGGDRERPGPLLVQVTAQMPPGF